MDSAKRVINGTWGEVWLDGEKLAECYGFQAKVSFNKEDIPRCGTLAVDKKISGTAGTGSLKLYKVFSRAGILIGEKIRSGQDARFTFISKLKDPDAYGAERIAIYNAGFDDLTLADWEAKTLGKTEMPFTFTDFEYLDKIAVR